MTIKHHTKTTLINQKTSRNRQAKSEHPQLNIDHFFNLSPDLLCVVGFDGCFKRLNPSWSHTLGYSIEELEETRFIDFVHPDDRETTIAEFSKITLGVTTIDFENRYRCHNNCYKWLSWKSVPDVGESLVYAVARDITKQKQAELALQQKTAEMQTFLDAFPDMFFRLSSNGTILDYRASSQDKFVTPPEVFIGQNMIDLLPRDSQSQFLQAILEVKQNKSITSVEYSMSMPSGEEYFEGRLLPFAEGQIILIMRQISDRKRAEIALQQKTAELQAFLDAFPDLFFRVSKTGVYLDYKSSHVHDLYAKPEIFIGKNQAEILPPDLSHKFGHAIHQCLETKSIVSIEYCLPIADHKDSYFEARVLPFTKDQVITIVRNITQRNKMESQLAQQQQNLRTIIDNAPIWIWMIDRNGRVISINKTFCEDVGIPEEVWLNARHYQEVLPQDIAVNFLTSDATCFSQDTPYHNEEIIPLIDGKYHYIETIKVKIKDLNNNVIGLVGLGVDVTEQKQIQKQLQESEKKFRELAQQEMLVNQIASQIRKSLDLDTILATAVQKIQELLQLDRCLFIWYHDQVTPVMLEIVHEARCENLPSRLGTYQGDHLTWMADKLINLEVYQIDNLALLPPSVERDFFLSLGYASVINIPLKTASGKIGIIGCGQCRQVKIWQNSEIKMLKSVGDQLAIAIDQAELYQQSKMAALEAQNKSTQIMQTLQQLEETKAQLIQAEKMSALGQLLTGIAAEINNPVSFIFGNIQYINIYTYDLFKLIELYQKNYPIPTAEIEKELVDIEFHFIKQDFSLLSNSLKKSVTRIRDIVKSLQSFSRLGEMGRKKIDLHQALDTTLVILENQMKDSKGEIIIELIKQYGKLPLVECDPSDINQVLLDIIANSIYALQSKNSPKIITITTDLIREKNQEIAMIKITDNGPGIPDEIKPRIFDLFFTTKPIGIGTGTGLTIAYAIIVDKHKGKLICHSEIDQGTEFIIYLPVLQST